MWTKIEDSVCPCSVYWSIEGVVDNLDDWFWIGVISLWTSCLKLGVMGHTTGQSYRSKSRPAEYFVNKCYWQYQFICWGLEKRDIMERKKNVALEKGEQQSKTCIRMFLLQKCAITKVPPVLERTSKSALFMQKCPFSQILNHAPFDSWEKQYKVVAHRQCWHTTNLLTLERDRGSFVM